MSARAGSANDSAAQLAQSGLRATRQRVAVLRLLQAEQGHPTALDVHARLVSKHPNLSQKTVYEILDALVEVGLARRVTQISGPARYEARMERHDHAWCRVCGKLFDLAPRTDRSQRGRSDVPDGFEVESVSITLEGRCSRCAGPR